MGADDTSGANARRELIITLIMIVSLPLSAALAVWHPLWLAPPHAAWTPALYLLLWLPVWIACDAVGTARRRLNRLWLAGLVAAPSLCFLFAPMTGVGMTFEAGSLDCLELDTGGDSVRYVCNTSSYRLELKGREGWLFARLVEFEGYDSVGPPALPTPEWSPEE